MAKGISTIRNGSTGSPRISTCCVTLQLDIAIFQGSLSALTEDNGPEFRRRSVPVARSWGCVLEAQGRRVRTAVVLDTRTPCRARLG